MRERPHPGGARILVVEDEHLVALDIQQCLSRMKYEPVVVYTGEAAVFAVEQLPIDLVVMDIKLPGGLDGIDAASEIRRARDIPVIYLTAYTDPLTIERARVTEPYGYVLKPFQERELMAAIEMALHRHDLEARRAEHQRIEHFLFEASARLTASLDFREVARDATEMLVPQHADACCVHLRETDDSVPDLTCMRPDEDRPVSADLLALIARVEAAGRTEGRVHPRSMICVPLIARGQTLGSLAMVFGEMREVDDLPDRTFIESFGQRLGLALDNAILYRCAQRAIELRDDVLAIVSHDLRAPLATVMLHAELLDEKQHKAAQGIRNSAKHMNRLIGDLLDASAINAGQLALERGVHPVSEVLEEAVEMFRAEAQAKDISLAATSQVDRAKVDCDRTRIVQVLANLISNALRFTPNKGSVHVSATRERGQLRIDVEDTGVGIPDEQVPKLFDRFWRAEARRDGAGLGLFIARGIVAAHGGSIGVETAVGHGSRFFFALPEAA